MFDNYIKPGDNVHNTQGMLLDHLWQKAYNAKSGVSFSPERRANQRIKEYSDQLQGDLDQIRIMAAKYNTLPEKYEAMREKYQNTYERMLCAWWHSESNCVSSMITGPARFPVAQQEKRHRWADNHYQEFIEWRSRALKAITKMFKPKPTSGETLDQYKTQLAQAEKYHEKMKKANEILRKKISTDDKKVELYVLGVGDNTIRAIMTPDYMNRTGFPNYRLTNSLANIKRLRERVQVLEQKKSDAIEIVSHSIPFEGGKLVLNYEIDRLQIFYDDKPASEKIRDLKSRGFHFSRFNGNAWQRQITPNAKSAAKYITGIEL